MVKLSLRRRLKRRMLILRRCIRRILDRFFMSCLRKTVQYRMLPHGLMSPSPPAAAGFASSEVAPAPPPASEEANDDLTGIESDADLVSLKITLLGDSDIGKTSFMEKYVGEGKIKGKEVEKGLSCVDKTLFVGGARISFSIWEIGGDKNSQEQIATSCKDSVAILIMFDLTSRCTLNSVLGWYQQARKWNQTAIPILIGTKFDEFIQLPIDLQWTIASQARSYAKATNATLFFSSATYNINVNKIFKFITAKLFDLPWTVERNLTVGEPIIDF